MMNSTTDMMTMLLACIAGISLLVGGIGIMNIMYVSVTERTREIGLRMSIGAKGRDILAQFLIEAILISVTGGLIGVVFGIGASWVVKLVAGWPVYVQLYSVVLSFVVCTVTGIFFGWYPAQKASNLDPIEAIRLNFWGMSVFPSLLLLYFMPIILFLSIACCSGKGYWYLLLSIYSFLCC